MSQLHHVDVDEKGFALVWTQRKHYLVLTPPDEGFYTSGDVIMLRELGSDARTGRQLLCLVVYADDDDPGVVGGWVVMGIKLLARLTHEESGFEAGGAATIGVGQRTKR